MNMTRTGKKRLCAVLIACNLIFIWGNSLLPGSVSEAFSNWVKSLLNLSELSGGHGGGLLRKLAHFTEFMSLGLLLVWQAALTKKKPWRNLFCGFLAAVLDESIQCFVPDRGPGIRDVMIDAGGVLAGFFLFLLGSRIYQFYFMEDTRL